MTGAASPGPARRWVVVGAAGLLGTDLSIALAAAGQSDVTRLDRGDVDITDPPVVRDVVGAALSDGGRTAGTTGAAVLVNCAAWTAVDDAETHEAAAFAVNATGPHLLARACADAGARMLHVSTDYVFDGTSRTPYAEDAALRPASAYGRTKAAGEWAVASALPGAHWLVRTGWLYGAHGSNFVTTMRRLAAERPTVDVVTDQVGQPTWSADLAGRLVDLVLADAPTGTYHGTSAGECSWFDLARAVFEGSGHDPERVRPTTSAAFVRPAPRPARSVLGHDAWARSGLPPLPHWRDALTRYLATADAPAVPR
ncbi:dTDP-4-dehydrorhamnose reductase [Kineosporia sp. A_224]|uniref:dTDP-4-dehydrorhamnose reductase n=1 Tax=Kineosporia sp. A_224 TaxID=1962180 RepID=UPI000B4A64A5|nr:dTDP-4-dehydrorhamnose reductase [Kineosporia sp. A_224]